MSAYAKSTVDNQRNTSLMTYFTDRLRIQNVEMRISNGLNKNCPRPVINRVLDIVRVAFLDKFARDVELLEVSTELIERSIVQVIVLTKL